MESAQGSDSPKLFDIRVEEWSNEELFDLLQGIKHFGSRDFDSIAKNIPTKTTDQIKKATEYYREKAIATVSTPVRRTFSTARTRSIRPPVPLSSWAKLLQDSSSFKDLHTETATAIRLIAQFENIPPAEKTNHIDFRSIYCSIADAMEGKTIPDNIPMAQILEKCMVETALTSKAYKNNSDLKNIVQGIDLSEQATRVLPKPTDTFELGILRHFASQKAYNPLNIPEEHLKPSSSSFIPECHDSW